MVGLGEQQLARAASERMRSWRVIATVNPIYFVAATPIVLTTPYVLVPVTRQRVPQPQTPVVRVFQPNPGNWSIRLKMEGEDLFGNFQRETSPIVPIEAKANNYIYMSRVYSRITSVSYAEATPTLDADIAVGYRGDPRKLVDANNAHYASRNHGWGTPLKMAPSPGWDILVDKYGEEEARARSQLRGVSMLNQTAAFQQWFFQEGALDVGANVAGWAGTHDKIGVVDWSKVIQFDGAPATYTAGDTVMMDFTVRTDL